MTDQAGIPFSFFISLLREISNIPPRRANASLNPQQIFRKWVSELQKRYSSLPQGTATSLFRLLFPEEDANRKYDMQETRLAQYLSQALGFSSQGRGQALKSWNRELSFGCLGEETRKVMQNSSTLAATGDIGPLTIAQVDNLLDELASTSAFTAHSIRGKYPRDTRQPKAVIIQSLFSQMPALDASFLTQIILKDLRPLLYPVSESHYTSALKNFNTKSVIMLRKEDAMKIWDPTERLLRIHKVMSTLDEAIKHFESTESGAIARPCVNVPVDIPKSVKGRGCAQALQHFPSSKRVWAETKYDGERAQIHVQVDQDGASRISIFSKSKRNSTMDRWAIHSTIRRALGLQPGFQARVLVEKDVILDAEMVAFSDSLNAIDEFWRIRSLIESTAVGPRRVGKQSHQRERMETQSSLVSNASDHGTRHLALVFFDVLYLDSRSLLHETYAARRKILESIIQPVSGHVMLAERTPVDLGGDGDTENLRGVFAKSIANHQEGVVLKADESGYNDWKLPWVKLKKDYIPGYGDAIDLVIVGASWDKDRARELRVPTGTYTTFYVGVLSNEADMRVDPTIRPHFEVYFTVSYGLDRDRLEELIFLVKNSDHIDFTNAKTASLDTLEFSFNLFPGIPRPSIIFQTPLLTELCGAGFTKAPSSKFYELRFPRITKVFRRSERSWKDAVTLRELGKIAREVIGRDRSDKDVDDWCNSLWGKPVSPGVKSAVKRKATEDLWEHKLTVCDKKAKLTGDKRVKPLKALEIQSAVDTKPTSVRESVFLEQVNAPKRFAPLNEQKTLRRVLSTLNAVRTTVDDPPSGLDTYSDHLERANTLLDIPQETHERILSTQNANQLDKSRNCLDVPPRSLLSTPMAKLLAGSLVWLASPRSASRPTWRASCNEIMPRTNRMSSLDSLLIGCGWEADSSGSVSTQNWIERGVVFVENDNSKKHVCARLSKIESVGGRTRKSVWVFDMAALGYDELNKANEVESQVLCKFN